MMIDEIRENIIHINKRIEVACKKANRPVQDVSLLLATKTVEPERILQAFACGCTLIGENKVQELKAKYDALAAVPHTAHFIGHLQSNKVKDVVKYAQCVQSVDRLDIAQKLEQHAAQNNRFLDILIEVNTSAEQSKSGCRPSEALQLIQAISLLPHIRIKGLMTIGLFSDNAEKVRSCFRCLKQLQLKMKEQAAPNVSMEVLSMGMSSDLEIAIEEGATLIRVGTAAFGARNYSVQHTTSTE